MPLIYTDSGNFLPRESDMSDLRATEYRAKIRKWAAAYEKMCLNYNRTGSVLTLADKPKYWFKFDFCKGTFKPKPNQVAPIVLGINAGRAAIFANMGFGKTYVTGYIGRYLQVHRGLAKKILVLCPKSALSTWKAELAQFFELEYSVFPENPHLDGDFILANYEQADKLIEAREEFGGIVLDESQRTKNMDTKTFESISALTDLNIFYRFVLTGTAMPNKPDDLFTQLSFINPYCMGFSHSFMKSAFFQKAYNGKFVKETFLNKYTKLFQEKAAKNAIIFSAPTTDVSVKEEYIGVELNDVQSKAIDDVHKGFTVLTGKKTITGQEPKDLVELKNVATKEAQVSSGFLKAGDQILNFKSRKIGAVFDDAMSYKGQVIIWTYFQNTTMRLHKAIPNSACIFGTTTGAQRTRIIEDFQLGKIRVLVLQLKAANTALNLQCCNYMLFAEYDWAHATIAQAVARIVRQGQTKTCTIKKYFTRKTIDEVMLEVIKTKKNVTSSIIRNYMTLRKR